MSVQTNFRAVDMLGGVKAAEVVVAPKKVTPKPASKKVEEPVAVVEPEVVVEPVVEEPSVVVADDEEVAE
jgi:hypothetical protein